MKVQTWLLLSLMTLGSVSAFADKYTQLPALSSEPAKAIERRLQHLRDPNGEEDEAFTARYREGTMTEEQERIFLEGASLDDQGKDYLQDMDNGITRLENRKKLVEMLDKSDGGPKFVPGITGDDAARRVARGRINWTIWTGGNDRFWDYMTRATFGGLDLLKTISDHPSLPATRDNRWKELGLVNEPCYEKATEGRAEFKGLWIAKRKAGCAPDPYENPTKYPGVRIGARGDTIEVGSMYGYPTGVVGLRLFPNPDFNKEAAKNWDADQFYKVPNYYNNPKLVRPYRVGMACAFCHVGPNPSHPPKDFNAPEWADLNSNPGAQYFWVDRILLWNYKQNESNFVYQLLHTSRPGALDTSLISSDQINNPRTMNAVYDLPARVELAARLGHKEMLSGGELNNAQFNTVNEIRKNPNLVPPQAEVLRNLFDNKDKTVVAPCVLKDCSDSVGALGALNRVYVNIGLFSEDWVQHFIPLVGGPILPGEHGFKIATAQAKSLYWRANENQTPDVALFFLAATQPDKLETALRNDTQPVPAERYGLESPISAQVNRGKIVFAETCARCHSSKLPEPAYDFFKTDPKKPELCSGPNYMNCWTAYWKYSTTPAFKDAMKKKVMEEDFLKDNFLSIDQRVPANLVDSQLCSPVATNGIKDNIWNDFSSTSYKMSPSVGSFLSAEPSLEVGKTNTVLTPIPDGGRGYLRPASLISLWSTAPFLGNNSLGKFDDRGTVRGRMESFQDSIRRLLWPEKRGQAYSTFNDEFKETEGADLPLGTVRDGKMIVSYTPGTYSYVSGKNVPGAPTLKGIIDVTTTDSFLEIPKGYLGNFWYALKLVMKLPGMPKDLIAHSTELGDYVKLGPIPAGVPINLISNLDFEKPLAMKDGVMALGRAIVGIHERGLQGNAARDFFMQTASAALLKASKCNDFVVNRGHYFGTEYAPDVIAGDSKALSDDDKKALIAFLKQM